MSLIKKSQVLLAALALTLGFAATSSAATSCDRSSGNFKSNLIAENQASATCGSGAHTKMQFTVENGVTGATYTTGAVLRCALSTDPVWFIQAGGFHIFQTGAAANNGVWGAVGGGLCSFYSYIAV